MLISGKKEGLLLLVGDVFFFTLALWLALFVRAGQVPPLAYFELHLWPFSIIFAVWLGVFFIADLYGRRPSPVEQRLPEILFRAQLVNSLIAALFFYFIPYFSAIGLTPRTTLFIDLIISFFLIWWWRRFVVPLLYGTRKTSVLFACTGPEVDEAKRELRANPRYRVEVTDSHAPLIIFNSFDPRPTELNHFYQRLLTGTRFVAIQDLYEALFGRVPLGLLHERWFLERISLQPKRVYDFFKRAMDIAVGGVLLVLSLPVYPLVALLIWLEDRGPLFFIEERIGRGGRAIKIRKFRSMTTEADLSARRVTRVGAWLRRSRLDELPQLLSVLRGDQSLIGPRPERPEYVELYRQSIPHYDIRHLIAPGLSGWAQIYHERHPHFRPELEATREKLSYDLYYIKNRSLWLDIEIGLKTIRTLLSRTGI